MRQLLETLETRRLLAMIVVNTTADDLVPNDGSVSLREAITAINAGNDLGDPDIAAQSPGAFGSNDTIHFNIAGARPQLIEVHDYLTLSKDMTIQGPGADLLTVARDAFASVALTNTVFTVGATVTLAGLTISPRSAFAAVPNLTDAIVNHGVLTINDCTVVPHYSGGNARGIENDGVLTLNNSTISDFFTTLFLAQGAGIYNCGTATLNNCTIRDNMISSFQEYHQDAAGGGICNYGSLIVRDSTISGNSAYDPSGFASSEGGGIFNGGQLTIAGSTISGNSAFGFGRLGLSSISEGGGIFNFGGQLTITGSTVSGNSASNYYAGGGGIVTYGGQLAITGSTISGNYAPDYGGAIVSIGQLTIDNSTIAGNAASYTGGVELGGSFTIRNSIIAQNYGKDLSGALNADSSYNFIGDTDGDPMLGSLADNGGLTQTMALLPGSPCINAGDPNFTPPPDYDQRGAPFRRVRGGRIDIGAFELPMNDAPTSSGIRKITVPEDAAPLHLSLRDYFDDFEDGSAALSYTLVGDTNPALFASTPIDSASDMLTLDLAHNANGVANITVRATDSGGLFVEDTFTVTVLSAKQQVQILQAEVKALPGVGAGNINSLLSKLDLKGNGGDAIKVSSFIDAMTSFLNAGKISQPDANTLLAAASDLLVSLG